MAETQLISANFSTQEIEVIISGFQPQKMSLISMVLYLKKGVHFLKISAPAIEVIFSRFLAQKLILLLMFFIPKKLADFQKISLI